MCYLLRLSRDTLHRWKKRTHFSDTIKRAKDKANSKVVEALFNRACGYGYIEERRAFSVGKKGRKTLKSCVTEHKYMPPDPKACMFWLINRAPEKWSFRPEQKHENVAQVTFVFSVIGGDGQPIQIPFDPKKPEILKQLQEDAK